MSSITAVLKAIRKESRLTQKEFAEKIDLKQNTYAMIEAGNNKPSIDLIKVISKVFKVNPLVFFNTNEDVIKREYLITENDYLNSPENDYLNSKSVAKPANSAEKQLNQLYQESKAKNTDALTEYYTNNPIGIKTKRLETIGEKHRWKLNRELVKEHEDLFKLSMLVEDLSNLIEAVLDVYTDTINDRPNPFEATQYFDLQSKTINIPDNIDYKQYRIDVIKWLESIKKFEPVIKQYYDQSLSFLESIETPENSGLINE